MNACSPKKNAAVKVRKTGTHGDFLHLLERMMAVTEWESMSTDEKFIYIFSKQSD